MFDQLQDLWAALTRIRKSTKRVFPYQEPQEPPGRSAPWAAHALQPISPQPQDAPLLTLDLPPPGVAGAAVPSGAGSCQPKQNKTGVTNPEIPNGMRGPQGADTSPGIRCTTAPRSDQPRGAGAVALGAGAPRVPGPCHRLPTSESAVPEGSAPVPPDGSPSMVTTRRLPAATDPSPERFRRPAPLTQPRPAVKGRALREVPPLRVSMATAAGASASACARRGVRGAEALRVS